MRIISKFHDYYDGVAKQGVDKTIVYLRESLRYDFIRNQNTQAKLDLPDVVYKYFSLNIPNSRAYQNDKLTLTYMVLGFCGKLYPLVEIHSHSSYVGSQVEEYDYAYSIEELQDILKSKYKTQLSENKRRFSFLRSSHDLVALFSQDLSKLEKYFMEYNCPTFLFFDKTPERIPCIATNVCLKTVQFFKQKDTFTCFQDISMYVSGVLRSPTPEMIKISDEDKLSKHGFDEWSFRKLPSKKVK